MLFLSVGIESIQMTDILVTDAGGASIKQVDVGGGVIMPRFNHANKAKAYFEGIPESEIRDDDIMLLSYVKTGMHVVFYCIDGYARTYL